MRVRRSREMAEQAAWIIHRGMKYVPQRDVAQARAEALAAVLAAFDKRKAVCDLDEELKQHGTIIVIFRHRIAELQPAASALEELLLKAKLEELQDWPELCNHPNSCPYHQRIAELEKARASEEKP
jgi:hypothetical protein